MGCLSLAAGARKRVREAPPSTLAAAHWRPRPWSSSLSVNLTGAFGAGTVDTTGGNISLSGILSGAGGLTKIGANSLTLSGSNTYSGNTTVSGGTLVMSGGKLSSPIQYVGYSGIGSFTQSGGTNTVSSTLELGYNSSDSGTYNLNGGLLVLPASGLTVGSGSATFNFGGGTLGATRPWSSSLNINMTGAGGVGTVNTTGGNISLSGNLSGVGGLTEIGPNTLTLTGSNTYSGNTKVDGGTLQVSGGRLSSPVQYVGYSLTAAVAQSGGTNTAYNALYLGYNTGASGSYALSSGSLSAAKEYLGYSGTGSFTQSGGTNSVSSTLELGYSSSGSGTYNLNGGLLALGSAGAIKGSGSASFNFGGGTLGASTLGHPR